MKQVILQAIVAVTVLIMTLVVLIALHKPKSTQLETVTPHMTGKRSLPGEKLAPDTLLGEAVQYDSEQIKEILQQNKDPFKSRR
jgi:hypothetical protein